MKKKSELNVFKFLYSDIGMKKVHKNNRKTFNKNIEIFSKNIDEYSNWVINILSNLYKKKDNERYNACSIYMNDKNIEKLHKYMDPVAWLYFAPTNCNELNNNEFGVDMESIVEIKNQPE